MTDKKTSLYDEHIKAGARMVSFAGWNMPIQYQGLKEEHLQVRQACGLFDVSHMGEIFFRGPKAVESLQYMTTNDVSKLSKGQAHYSIIPNAEGGIVDDIIVYCVEPNQEYLVCVNASNIEKDYNHLVKYNRGAEIKNESDAWSQIAIQGPKAAQIIEKIFAVNLAEMASFTIQSLDFEGEKVIMAKTGYTGEDGVEVFVSHKLAPVLWQKALASGDVLPIGLGARDTLRLEKKYPLYGHELSDTTSPIEAKLNWVVKLDKGDFLGKEKILALKEAGAKRSLVCLKMIDRGIPREEYKIFSLGDKEIGIVTSGTMSPSLNVGIAIAYVESSQANLESKVKVDIRGRKALAIVVKPPFV